MLIRSFITCVAVAMVFLACGPKTDSPQNRLENAYEKIDQAQYDEAIADLEELVADTESDRAREALASAYAARAGVSVHGYWKFIASFAVPDYKYGDLKQKFITQALRKLRDQGEQTALSDLGDSMTPLIQSLSIVQDYAYRLELLEPLKVLPSDDFEKAIDLLGQIDRRQRGSYLYRALLRLILIKTFVVAHAADFRVQDKENSCHLHLSGVKEGVRVIGHEVRKLLFDLQAAYPSEQSKLQKHDQFLEELITTVAFVPDELDLRDFDLSLTNSFFSMDQKLWRCPGE